MPGEMDEYEKVREEGEDEGRMSLQDALKVVLEGGHDELASADAREVIIEDLGLADAGTAEYLEARLRALERTLTKHQHGRDGKATVNLEDLE